MSKKYNIGESLGFGIFGESFLVVEKTTNKKFVAKYIKADKIIAKDADEVFSRMKKLKNPYLLEYYEYFYDEETDSYVLVMEYCKSNLMLKE